MDIAETVTNMVITFYGGDLPEGNSEEKMAELARRVKCHL